MYITLKRKPVIGFAISREKMQFSTSVSLLFLCWIIEFDIRKKHTA
jgi:hypothetical protein